MPVIMGIIASMVALLSYMFAVIATLIIFFILVPLFKYIKKKIQEWNQVAKAESQPETSQIIKTEITDKQELYIEPNKHTIQNSQTIEQKN